ncbi:MAG: NTP transferase domain-containing protein [Bdellovibrionales bacterium]|nr:NTP transferase domain-containing protein [Bdellovibrionales bacterium]
MEVMLLAAGLGTRLQALTKSTPKCLIPVADRPILEWNLLKLRELRPKRIVINLHYLPNAVEQFLSEQDHFQLPIEFSREGDLLNTGGGLMYAADLFDKDGPLLILNADILCSASLEDLIDSHQSQERAASLVTRSPEDSRVLLFDSNTQRLVGWRNNATGESRTVFAGKDCVERGFCGIQVVSPVIFDYLGRPEEKRSIIEAYLDASKEGLSIQEHRTDDSYWFDIGTPEQLEECRRFFKERGITPLSESSS